MKKVLTIVCAALFTFSAFAQDVNQATDLYNNGATALGDGDKASALAYFQKAHEVASSCGEVGEEIVAQCQDIIPTLYVSLAKDLIKEGAYDQAVEKLQQGIEVSTAFGNEDKAEEASRLIPQVYMQKGTACIKSKDYASAIEAYKTVLEADPANGRACLMLAQSYEKAGDLAAAEDYYMQAAGLGQEKNAYKQLTSIYVKKAVSALQGKDFQTAKTAAEYTFQFGDNDKAYRVAGQAAMQLGDNETAIKYFKRYIELAPSASDAPQIRDAIAALEKAASQPAK